MKKTAILAIACAMPAMAGTPAPLAPAPIPAPAPIAQQCAVEVAGVYRYTSRDISSVNKSIDTYGLDVTAVHSFTPEHAATLRLGYAYGSEVFRPVAGFGIREEIQSVSLMPGYRYTQAIDDQWSWFAGVNAGIAWVQFDLHGRAAGAPVNKYNEHDWAFAASAEIGVSYKVCDHTSVFAAYELSGNTAKFLEHETHQQVYHGLRVGLHITF